MGGFVPAQAAGQGGRPPGKIDASLNEKLKAVEWGEYRLGELFEIENTISFNTNKLTIGNAYDYITRTSLNQGIFQNTGFVNAESINHSGVWSLGLLQMDFFYRNKPWYAGQFVRKIIPKIAIPTSAVLYFSTLLNKQKQRLLSVLVRNVDKTFCETVVELPVRNKQIDFDFIKCFTSELEKRHIAKLEAQRYANLEAYLSVAGLKDARLSEEEERALRELENMEWRAFNLKDLFGKSTRGRRLKSEDRLPGDLPFVTAGEADEGISAFISNDVEVFSENTTTIDMFGSAKYRGYSYGGDDHIAVVHTEKTPKYAAMFITSAIHKAAHTGKFDYGHNFYAKDADELWIMLPVKGDQPDHQAMETIVSAVQKLVIKDVVAYADQRIAATKAIVERQ